MPLDQQVPGASLRVDNDLLQLGVPLDQQLLPLQVVPPDVAVVLAEVVPLNLHSALHMDAPLQVVPLQVHQQVVPLQVHSQVVPSLAECGDHIRRPTPLRQEHLWPRSASYADPCPSAGDVDQLQVYSDFVDQRHHGAEVPKHAHQLHRAAHAHQ